MTGRSTGERLFVSGTTATFEEDSTHFRVTVPSSAENFRSGQRDRSICSALRAEHIKRSLKETRAQRRKQAEEQLPKSAGDLVIKGEDEKGRLRYTWKDVEVLVTPLEKRDPPPENASKAAIARAKEPAPDQALRKMKEKLRRMITKATRGECERIIAKSSAFASSHALAEERAQNQGADPWPIHMSPALGKLDDPIVRSHLREAFSYLRSMKLHYCQNCDEEWPVFTGHWPQGGVETAGPKAGPSETILRVGWMASTRNPQLCYRCFSSTIRREMYSKDNLQHLGERHEPLSNLTWFERPPHCPGAPSYFGRDPDGNRATVLCWPCL